MPVGLYVRVSCFPVVFVYRHSRFRGSYVVQGLKSIGEKDVIFHHGLHNVSLHQKALPWVCSGVTVVAQF